MRDALPAIRGAGAELVIIGNGTPEQAAAFAAAQAPDIAVYTDPSLQVYRAVDAGSRVFHPRVVPAALRAVLAGYRQRRVEGSPTQLGAVLIILQDGSIAWSYHSRWAGDHPSAAAIVDAVRRATRGGAGRGGPR